jgi:predicted 2-oxoglutarate/Fe(II)-dependent dioxygenase YbiX
MSEKKIIDFINVCDNIMTPFVCDLILNEYKSSDEWEIEDKNPNKSIFVSHPNVMNKNFKIRDDIDRLIECSIARIIRKTLLIYSQKYRFLQACDTGYKLISQINDTNFNNFSMGKLFIFISLSENYTGGEFSFFDDEIKIKVPKGSGLIFPSNPMFPHKISPVTNGENFCITTWIK